MALDGYQRISIKNSTYSLLKELAKKNNCSLAQLIEDSTSKLKVDNAGSIYLKLDQLGVSVDGMVALINELKDQLDAVDTTLAFIHGKGYVAGVNRERRMMELNRSLHFTRKGSADYKKIAAEYNALKREDARVHEEIYQEDWVEYQRAVAAGEVDEKLSHRTKQDFFPFKVSPDEGETAWVRPLPGNRVELPTPDIKDLRK